MSRSQPRAIEAVPIRVLLADKPSADRIVTPQTWRAAVVDLLAARDKILGPGACILDPKQRAESDSPEEHVIPQGTGVRWLSLPPGAISRAANNRASAWEKAFLREGTMGLFRPFYVRGKKRYEVTDSLGRKIAFANDPTSGFQIEAHDFPNMEFPTRGSGTLEFSLWIKQPPTLLVSKALTKLAYLGLCVVMPSFALSSALDPVRNYLAEDNSAYVPYGEHVILRAPPAVGLWFRLTGKLEGKVLYGEDLIASVRIHHMQYFVPLLGELDDATLPERTRLQKSATPAGKRKVDFAYSFSIADPQSASDTDGHQGD